MNGSVYVLSFPAASPLLPSRELCSRITTELQSHLAIVANSQAIILLVVRSVGLRDEESQANDENLEMESPARMRDLSLWQLADDRNVKLSDILGLVGQVQDSIGSLEVTNRLSAPRGSTMVFEIRYQTHAKRAQLWSTF